MNPQQLRQMADESDRVSLVLPRPWKGRPKDFPRGELLCEQPTSNVVSIKSTNLIKWLDKHGL